MRIRIIFAAIFLAVFAQTTSAQKATIRRIEQTADELVVYYDLEDTEKSRTFLMQLFSSTNNFSAPLDHVSGDVGIDVKPGVNRKISWGIRRELGDKFVGDIQLEIRGKLYVPFIAVDLAKNGNVIKRAKPTELNWRGDTNGEMLNFSLFRRKELVTVIPNLPNTGKAEITLPGKIKPGDGYHFVINEVGNKEHTIKTGEFRVKERIPLLVKMIPAAVVVGVVIILIPEKKPDTVGAPEPPPKNK
jgi:hypothetical protein